MSERNTDDDIVNEMMPAFINEANEQCDALEQLLLQLEDAPEDRTLLDALFRCAHTIKGSAGVFGLDRVVTFTHHVEALLQLVREGQVSLTPALSTLLLQSNDVIRTLVNSALDDLDEAPNVVQARDTLVSRLKAAMGVTDNGRVTLTAEDKGTAAIAGEESRIRRWMISIRFDADTFRHGIDPLTLLNYVRGMGCIPAISCDMQAIPKLDAFDPESCHLAFQFSLDTEATQEEIERAFKFVREDSELHIIEPGASPKDVIAFIESMPDNPRLGEILVAAGAITRAQLVQGLHSQSEAAEEAGQSGPAPRLGEVLQSTAAVSPTVVAAALQKQQRQRAAPTGSTGDDNTFIRVHADRLDEVINLLGELVIAGAGASMLARQTQQRNLMEANQQVSRLIESIRNSTLKLRMVPIGETFARFRRVVRDTAAELGKEVALEIVGGETELDKAMVERIADPLMHLVRNALDHGLETPEQRLAAGKSRQGTLTLNACHEAGGILIRIIDDGRGIQRDKILARAWERGLLDEGVVPPDEDILNLIFAPGFSTAETVTNLSGRGVGMDVVRSNVEALRGSVTITSEVGKGSCMEIRLPLTLAIIDGFLVSVGSSKFILPLESVVEVISDRETATAVDSRGRCCVELRGEVLPVVDLRTLYALDSQPPERSSVVVVRAGSRRYGVLVDSLLGQHQTVIKPLGLMLRSLRGVSGSSILGSGEVALIFDTASLGQLAAQSRPTSGTAVTNPHL
ncbi:MAG TPA: chemotaxis protein CheA [Aquabacterium sp.]|uniref:chemotaxis protein CheA n=1 Tax=Aquabacterium sp. TaxID=1872578 RepID=UPI002E34A4B1|nr:chemotaxis protein CheA [Aquabacterium sp.]HEX5357559.1 chemotaxis protein CheA [Aquabacterium sp.]